ncbi:hypothetical protein HBO15_22610 [Pseudomonas sp. WS 5111]|jgi:3-methyladenine DNA glycosylase AlkC|uniref:hypothetical protein n=1 Tax=unclassified Pseudomonas TaxID=196821 RepID=UPI0014753F9F|nr:MULTISPECIES: hypothetical protein [unclassified Pseudomonas]NMX60030.1 hypothetical protein [Pseudomonas sp. WS 5079]NMX70151.1 hypothetical protein [Pseudomonas sp. WS 5111]NMX85602.1 hypothetical protein [Pseudomonas sp. WS 5010]NMY28003.1 hypothetical protein [Pseudomonas sp. WS 5021]
MSEERKDLIDQGRLATRNLGECLAVDQVALARAIAPQLEPTLAQTLLGAAQASQALGISKKVAGLGLALGQWLESTALPLREQTWRLLLEHPSDTVRSWAAFANAYCERHSELEQALLSQFQFATDPHFGVREWAWIALRPLLAQDLAAALVLLRGHARSDDPLIRRFCVEILRPRGVWCEHIAQLKSEPQIAEPLLIAMLDETDKYAQDSVANWINDASKTRPDWVRDLFERYPPSGKAASRIFTRATRSLSQ